MTSTIAGPAMRWLRFSLIGASLTVLGSWTLAQPDGKNGQKWSVAPDIQAVLKTKRNVDAASVGRQGVPTAVLGKLGHITHAKQDIVESDLMPVLTDLAPAFRLKPQNLHLKRIHVDELGSAHAVYGQVKNGLEVVGSRFSLHIDKGGAVYAAFGSARDGETLPDKPGFGAKEARSRILAHRSQALEAKDERLVYVICSKDQSMHLAWESYLTGFENGVEIDEHVYVDALNGEVVEVRTNIWPVESRKIYKDGG